MQSVEVLIQIESGEIYFPKEIPVRLSKGKGYPYNRMGGIIETIRDLAKDNLLIWSNVKHDSFRGKKGENVGKVFRIYGDEEYFYTYNPKAKKNVIYRIKRVDISTPWEIRKSDNGGEYIYKFRKEDKFKIVDKELNYGVSVN